MEKVPLDFAFVSRLVCSCLIGFDFRRERLPPYAAHRLSRPVALGAAPSF